MIEKINTNQIHDIVEKSPSNKFEINKASINGSADIDLQIDYASLLNKAVQSPQTDTEDIQRARELLASGQLESPENIRQAAENIIKFGI
jgi:hypothetical protein